MTNRRVAEYKDAFRRDGFLQIPDYLNDLELDDLRMYAAPHLERAPKTGKFPGVLKDLALHDAWFKQLLFEGSHIEFIRNLAQFDLTPMNAGCFLKHARRDDAVIAPHRDTLASTRRGCTLWIALDETSDENGCLHYLRGSHKNQLSEPEDSPENIHKVIVDPGSCTIHDGRTLHWSFGNRSGEDRASIVFFYFEKLS